MNRATLLSLALLAGAPALGLAQTLPPSGGTTVAQPNTNLQVQRVTPVTSSKSNMYEDIEIMRRILSRELRTHLNATCVSCHVAVSGMPHLAPGNAFSPDGPSLGDPNQLVSSALMHARNIASSPNVPTGSAHAVDVDGAYLSDYGVVFHVAMPAHAPVRIDPSKLVVFRSAVDDWDRTRRELRGEAPDKAASPETKKTVDVVDVLLRLMAENGRHFSKLGEKEKLTIIVNFRPAIDPHGKSNHAFLSGVSDTLNTRRLIWGTASPQASGAGNPLTSTADAQRTPGLATISGGTGDFELLGDLQIKQGKVQEAIVAYEKAVETQEDATRKSSLYRKLAETYLKSGGKSDAVAKAIEYLQRAQKNVATPTQERDANANKKDREPQRSKLILTAPKSYLDAAKTMSPEEFRKGVHVERIPMAQTLLPKVLTPVR